MTEPGLREATALAQPAQAAAERSRTGSDKGGFGDPAHKARRVASLGCAAGPVMQFSVGVGRVHKGEYTSKVKLRCRAATGGRLPSCVELRGETARSQPDGQPDAGRTYKHLWKLAAPVSACKLLIDQ